MDWVVLFSKDLSRLHFSFGIALIICGYTRPGWVNIAGLKGKIKDYSLGHELD